MTWARQAPAGASPAGVAPARMSPAGLSPAGMSPAGHRLGAPAGHRLGAPAGHRLGAPAGSGQRSQLLDVSALGSVLQNMIHSSWTACDIEGTVLRHPHTGSSGLNYPHSRGLVQRDVAA